MKAQLIAEILRRTAGRGDEDPLVTEIAGLTLLRSDNARHPSHILFRPALCLVVQGSKWTAFGDTIHHYGEGEALVVGIEMPGVSQVVAARPGRPYCGVILELDPGAMSEALAASDVRPGNSAVHGACVADCHGPLIDCALRAVRLLDRPRAIELLLPGVMRELCYWLVNSPNGAAIAGMVLGNAGSDGIVRAIHMLRDRFAEPVRMAQLARVAGLSLSGFHRQFKILTAMSPLQYQKRLRLLEARRRLLASGQTVEQAAFEVGYVSPSQFSRDYARLFGAPPRRDIAALRRVA